MRDQDAADPRLAGRPHQKPNFRHRKMSGPQYDILLGNQFQDLQHLWQD